MAKPRVDLLTPRFRVSYPNLFIPRKANAKSEPKFDLTMLFGKNEDLAWYKAGIKDIMTQCFGADETKWPKNLRKPMRDGDEKEASVEGYKDSFFMTARCCGDPTQRAYHKPTVLDQNKRVIESPDEFYAGCYARATISLYFYDTDGNKGIGCGLRDVQKLADGERFSSRASAADSFDVVAPAAGEQAAPKKNSLLD